jgi:hypothetical protein
MLLYVLEEDSSIANNLNNTHRVTKMNLMIDTEIDNKNTMIYHVALNKM